MKIQVETDSLVRVSILVLLIGCALYYMLHQFSFGFNTGDEGVALMGAWRIAAGEIPHREFFEVIPPFSFLPTALAFSLFGTTLATSRVIVFLYASLLIVLSERLLRTVSSSTWSRMLLSKYSPRHVGKAAADRGKPARWNERSHRCESGY